MEQRKIASFLDLEVYQEAYALSIEVASKLLPLLPPREKYDLVDQLSRSTKAPPRLIAEGYAKKHQPAGFRKYLDDVMAEVNESVVGIAQAKDIYRIDPELCDTLIDRYTILGRRVYRLAEAWKRFHSAGRRPRKT